MTYAELKQKEIINTCDGARLGNVCDLDLSADGRILALVAPAPFSLAGLFKGKKWGIFVGTVVGCAGRFIVHYISGVTIYKILAPTELLGMTFSSPSLYSLVYNGSYMLPNTLLALLFAALLYFPLKKYILAQDLAGARRK